VAAGVIAIGAPPSAAPPGPEERPPLEVRSAVDPVLGSIATTTGTVVRPGTGWLVVNGLAPTVVSSSSS